MPYEKLSCVACGAPINHETNEESVVCSYCSTRNHFKANQLGNAAAVDPRLMDFITKEAINSKYQRTIETSTKAKVDALKIRDQNLQSLESRRKADAEAAQNKNSKFNGFELILTLLGLLIWGGGIILIIYLLTQGEWAAGICAVLPIGFFLGAGVMWMAWKINTARTKGIVAEKVREIDATYRVKAEEIRNVYNNEIRKWDEELDNLQKLTSPSASYSLTPEDISETSNMHYEDSAFMENILRLLRRGNKIDAIRDVGTVRTG